MFEGITKNNMSTAIEAMLFVSTEPVSTESLAEMLQADVSDVEIALHRLQKDLEDGHRGIQIAELGRGWRLLSHSAFHDLIEKYVLNWDFRKLSDAALEVLGVIAYMQPVTRSMVASIRGVNSDGIVSSLLDKGLIKESGSLDKPGNPTIYSTSQAFFEKFGLKDVKDLPNLEDFAPDEETCLLIRERLGKNKEVVKEELIEMVAPEKIDLGEITFDTDNEG
ncbi:MAG: SMC-Scp complex subunit ScpB [Eggerthellaceae bacterium]|nr:SMC-Scp complex subunit ScpB [Eggerthellaceae bacterium]